jgi:hypothetical protein
VLTLLIFLLLQASVSIHGLLIDGKTGEPIAQAQVVLSESRRTATTDENGRFEFPSVPQGVVTIYANVAGYSLAKKTVNGEVSSDIEIILVPEGAAVKEEITVTTKPFDLQESSAASEQSLNKSEIQSASMVLIGDALRSAQALPGIAANNDLRADFSVRGAGFDRVGVYVDGILTDNFVHSYVGSNTDDRVSLSLIDQDTVETLSVLPGAFPSRYGDSSAAITIVDTREGNRVRPTGRFGTGLIATSGVFDGPLAHNRGSWLVSGRTSYVNYLQRLVEHVTGTSETRDDSRVGFNDASFKTAYDLSPVSKVGLSGIAGTFGGNTSNHTANLTDRDAVDTFRSRNSLINGFWKYTPSQGFVSNTRVFLLKSKYRDNDAAGFNLDNKDRTQFGARSDAALEFARLNRAEFGFYGRKLEARKTTTSFRQPVVNVLEDYKASGEEDSYYAQDSWSREGVPLSVVLGARVEHSDTTDQALFSPRGGIALNFARRFTARAGAGVYRQFPDFDELFGYFGNTHLHADKAIHYNLRLETEINDKTRFVSEAYSREERRAAFALDEPRLGPDGKGTAAASPFDNLLNGYGRGLEFTLQRRTANGLTGWVSYAYSRTWLNDARDHLSFVSDFDQRHTVTFLASKRVGRSIVVSSQFRYGSGQPIVGFLTLQGSKVALTSVRNGSRLNDYSRLDLRASKGFLRGRWKWTLSGEVLNLLNHENTYDTYSDLVRFRLTGSYSVSTHDSFGILPAVGLHVEF